MRTVIGCIMITAFAAACSSPAPESKHSDASPPNALAVPAHEAHENYVRAINSNNIDSLTSMFTDDVIFLTPESEPVIGKAAVREWAQGYYKAFHTKWDKPVQDLMMSGDNIIERYSYTSTDTPMRGGKDVVGTGWGLVVYHRGTDGKWRVARDAFGPDHPAK